MPVENGIGGGGCSKKRQDGPKKSLVQHTRTHIRTHRPQVRSPSEPPAASAWSISSTRTEWPVSGFACFTGVCVAQGEFENNRWRGGVHNRESRMRSAGAFGRLYRGGGNSPNGILLGGGPVSRYGFQCLGPRAMYPSCLGGLRIVTSRLSPLWRWHHQIREWYEYRDFKCSANICLPSEHVR